MNQNWKVLQHSIIEQVQNQTDLLDFSFFSCETSFTEDVKEKRKPNQQKAKPAFILTEHKILETIYLTV